MKPETTNEEALVYMENLHVGQRFSSGPLPPLTQEDIIAFARQYDPQTFHLDTTLAKDTVFGQLVASGWHTASLTMSLIVKAMPKMPGGVIGRQIEKMGWPRPVLPGDQLRFEAEILELRASGSNPGRGVMRVKNTTFNQKNEPVLEMESVIFAPRRKPTA